MRDKRKGILSLALILAMVVQLFSGLVNVAQAASATEVTITGLGGSYKSISEGATEEQIGFLMAGASIASEYQWKKNATVLNNFLLNSEEQKNSDGWYIRLTASNGFALAKNQSAPYIPAEGDVITFPQGMQIQINGTDIVYEIAEDFTIKYDGAKWAKYTEATSLTISGRFTGTDSAVGASTTQLGFSTNETIDVYESAWLNCTMTSGSVTLNGAAQSTWYIRIVGKQNLNLACPNYTPVAKDIIKIPAGTQFTYGTSVYEIAEDYTIQYDGATWSEYVEVTSLTISGRFTGTDSAAGASTTQLGLSTDETIDVYESAWLNCTMTLGSATLNGAAQSTWYIRITGAKNLNLACPNYIPVENDVIKILAGTQFTYGTSVYEIAEDYTIQYDGATWSEYVEITSLTISGRYTGTDSAAGASTIQLGLSTNETIDVYESAWLNCTMSLGSVTLNDAAQSTWYIRIAGKNILNLACPEYTPVVNDIIKIPAGTQFTYGTSVFEIKEDYAIKYTGSIWIKDVEAKTLTIDGRFEQHDFTNPTRIGFKTSEIIDVFEKDWLTCNIISGNVQLNDEAQNGWQITIAGTNHLILVCNNYMPVAKDVIRIPAGTQFIYGTSLYEIKEDYAIKYTGKTWIKDVEITTLTINGRYTGTDSTSGTTTQIGFQTNETIDIYEKDWLTCKVVSEGIKLNGVVQNGWYMRIVGTNNLNLACPEYTPMKHDAISIPAGTQFIYETNVYEIKEKT